MLRRSGSDVDFVMGVDMDVTRLDAAMSRYGDAGYYVLCRDEDLDDFQIKRMRQRLRANGISLMRSLTLTVDWERPQWLADRIASSMTRMLPATPRPSPAAAGAGVPPPPAAPLSTASDQKRPAYGIPKSSPAATRSVAPPNATVPIGRPAPVAAAGPELEFEEVPVERPAPGTRMTDSNLRTTMIGQGPGPAFVVEGAIDQGAPNRAPAAGAPAPVQPATGAGAMPQPAAPARPEPGVATQAAAPPGTGAAPNPNAPPAAMPAPPVAPPARSSNPAISVGVDPGAHRPKGGVVGWIQANQKLATMGAMGGGLAVLAAVGLLVFSPSARETAPQEPDTTLAAAAEPAPPPGVVMEAQGPLPGAPLPGTPLPGAPLPGTPAEAGAPLPGTPLPGAPLPGAPNPVADVDPPAEPSPPAAEPAEEAELIMEEEPAPAPAQPEPVPVTLDPEADAKAVARALRRRSVRALDIVLVSPTASSRRAYQDAETYCAAHEVDGVRGWRLPEIGELASLHEAKMVPRDAYWSRTAADTFGDRRLAWIGKKSKIAGMARRWTGARAVCVRKREG